MSHERVLCLAPSRARAQGCAFFLTAYNRDKVIAKIHARCAMLRMKPLSPEQSLALFLSIAQTERVGYEPAAVELIFKRGGGTGKNANASLVTFIQKMQEIFWQHEFVSYINACKNICPEIFLEKKVFAAKAALEPLERCPKCTLVPPCQHISEFELAERGLKRRDELPEREDGLFCMHFCKDGACRIFNIQGHCSLHHPKDKHEIVLPPKRCSQCTLPWPCGHCAFTRDRKRVDKLATDIAAWVALLFASEDALRECAAELDKADILMDVNELLELGAELREKAEKVTAYLGASFSTETSDYTQRRRWLQEPYDVLARKASGYIGELPEDDAAADAGASPAKPDPGARGGSRGGARGKEAVQQKEKVPEKSLRSRLAGLLTLGGK